MNLEDAIEIMKQVTGVERISSNISNNWEQLNSCDWRRHKCDENTDILFIAIGPRGGRYRLGVTAGENIITIGNVGTLNGG